MRLIDADKYLENVCTFKETGCGSCILQTKCPQDAETVEAIPIEFIEKYIKYQDTEEQKVLRMMWHAWELVEKENETKVEHKAEKEGKWIVCMDCEGKTRTCTCSICGYKTGPYTWKNPNFCANCGADMRGRLRDKTE